MEGYLRKLIKLSLPIVAAGLLLTGCGADAAAGLCEKTVKDTLLNPETLEFRDFTAASDEQAKAILLNYMLEEANVSDEYRDSPTFASMAGSALSGLKDANPGTELFQARIRADGAVGNTITKQAVCGVYLSNNIKTCQCVF